MSARGFTLVELLVVVALIAVVASMGSLRLFRRNRQIETAGHAQQISLLAARARLLALGNRSQVQLRIDPGDSDSDGQVATVRQATLPGFSPATLAFGPTLDNVPVRPGVRVNGIARGADVGGTPATSAAVTSLIFAPDGSARIDGSGTSGATFYLRDETGHNPQRVVIFGRTGMAKLLAQ